MKFKILIWITMFIVSASGLMAHPPVGHPQKHRSRFNCDPHLGGCLDRVLPLPYRTRLNRPRYIGGMVSYLVSPTSQEGMEWHEQVHRGSYSRPYCPPVCDKYYFPKTWDLIPMGARNCQKDEQRESLEKSDDAIVLKEGNQED